MFARLFSIPIVLALWLDILAVAFAEEPRVTAVVTDTPPKIDGNLSEEVWKKAGLIDGLTEMHPDPGDKPSDHTEVRVLRDDRNLYFGFRCETPDSSKVRRTIMQRDQRSSGDDYVFVVIDPYGRGREANYFRISAAGGVAEGTIAANSGRSEFEWDTIWDAACEVKEGSGEWTAEMSIPFRSLAFDPEVESWRLNAGRYDTQHEERARWTATARNRSWLRPEGAGHLDGVGGARAGRGLDLVPFVTGRWSSEDGEADQFSLDPGLDAFYQITPSLRLTVSWQTDFAETEVDDRQLNLTRFPLFFPEKRDFFLEGQEYFRFGGVMRTPLAFHSRNIGLSTDGERVPIELGAKLTGRVGPIGVGLLGVGLDSLGDLTSDEVYTGRLTLDVFDESQVGVIFTEGDPRRGESNTLYGVDALLKDTDFGGRGSVADLDLYYMKSDDNGVEDDAWGVEVGWSDDPIRVDAEFSRTGEEFRPGMGFLQRGGIYRSAADARYRIYPEGHRWEDISFATEVSAIQDLNWDVESIRFDPIEIEADFFGGDELSFQLSWDREVLEEDFEIVDGVVLPPGNYEALHGTVGFDSSSSRDLSGFLIGNFGEFWNGTKWRAYGGLLWRPNRHFYLRGTVSHQDNSLDQGDFETWLTDLDLRVSFTPDLYWNTSVQYDNISEEIGLNSRVRWTMAPGRDLFVVYNRSLIRDDRSFRTQREEGIVKLGFNLRF